LVLTRHFWTCIYIFYMHMHFICILYAFISFILFISFSWFISFISFIQMQHRALHVKTLPLSCSWMSQGPNRSILVYVRGRRGRWRRGGYRGGSRGP
jgi:hypothetical protein